MHRHGRGARRHRFELTLPKNLKRPPLLGRRQTPRRLKREGLWNSEVLATIDVTYDVHGTTATPRDLVFRLVDAEPLLPHATSAMFES